MITRKWTKLASETPNTQWLDALPQPDRIMSPLEYFTSLFDNEMFSFLGAQMASYYQVRDFLFSLQLFITSQNIIINSSNKFFCYDS